MVSPSRREREQARRRYQKWQAKVSEREAARRRRRRQNTWAAAIAAVIVVVALLGTWLANRNGSPASAAGKPSATRSTTATSSADPCPASSVTSKPSPSSYPSAPDAATVAGKKYTATLATTCGTVQVALEPELAPKAVASFVFLAEHKYFDGTPCHRLVTQGIYVLQCGDPTGTGTGGPGYSFGPVENAPKDNVYPAGTLAMARQGDKGDSNGSQFFLVYKDSPIPADTAGGYTVFGKITSGLDVVQRIAAGGASNEKPNRAVSLDTVTVSPS